MRPLLPLLPIVGVAITFAASLWGALAVRAPTPPGVHEPTNKGGLPNLQALEECFGRTGARAQNECYAAIFGAHLAARSPDTILADIDALQQERPAFRTACHDMVHILGRLWIAKGGTVRDGFARGSGVCHSGFFHGMMERVFLTDADPLAEYVHVTPEDVRSVAPTICTAESLGTNSNALRFQCLHGLGHALHFSLGYDFRLSLDACDLLPTAWDRSSCHGGAFMENITADDTSRRDLHTDDPLYPCTAVPEHTRASCYRMQTSWMRESGMSWDEITTTCRRAGPYRLDCFRSLGRDLSPLARKDGPTFAATTCEQLPEDERTECIVGGIAALADHAWDGRYAYPFCSALTLSTAQETCFAATHRHLLTSLEQNRAVAEQRCRELDTSEEERCLQALPAT